MPGLIRGVARTAAIAGTATAVSNNVSRRQHTRWNDREAEAQAKAYQQQQYQQAQMAQQQGMPPAGYAQPAPYAAPPAAPPQAAPAAAPVDLVAEIQKLVDLRNAGALTEAEFEVAKARVLAG